jgi:hypothetical protein
VAASSFKNKIPFDFLGFSLNPEFSAGAAARAL